MAIDKSKYVNSIDEISILAIQSKAIYLKNEALESSQQSFSTSVNPIFQFLFGRTISLLSQEASLEISPWSNHLI